MDDVAVSSPGRSRRAGLGIGLRGLILGWSLWLLGSWVVLWVMGGWTMPALRVMVLAGLFGMMGVWPAVRLSQITPAPGRSRGASGVMDSGGEVSGGAWARVCGWTLLDWVALNAVFQAVVWPLQLAAKWTLAQTLWLVLATAGWSLLSGLIVAWGRGTNRPGWRSGAMVGCVGVVILEPVLWWIGLPTAGSGSGGLGSGGVGVPEMRFSPLQAVWGVSTAGSPGQAEAAIAVHGFQIAAVAAAAVVGWLVLWVLLGVRVGIERSKSPAG